MADIFKSLKSFESRAIILSVVLRDSGALSNQATEEGCKKNLRRHYEDKVLPIYKNVGHGHSATEIIKGILLQDFQIIDLYFRSERPELKDLCEIMKKRFMDTKGGVNQAKDSQQQEEAKLLISDEDKKQFSTWLNLVLLANQGPHGLKKDNFEVVLPRLLTACGLFLKDEELSRFIFWFTVGFGSRLGPFD